MWRAITGDARAGAIDEAERTNHLVNGGEAF
jgi:hypothetical protein